MIRMCNVCIMHINNGKYIINIDKNNSSNNDSSTSSIDNENDTSHFSDNTGCPVKNGAQF